MTIEYISAGHFHKLGIGQNLIEAALIRFPETILIRADSLVLVNEIELSKVTDAGQNLDEAIRFVPLFKIFERLGCSAVVAGSVKPGGGFTVEKTENEPIK